jgi:ferredoxin
LFMKVKVRVDEKLCIGSGTCVVLASEHFELNDDGKAELKPSEHAKTKGSTLTLDVNSAGKEKLLEAARACPVQAISIADEKGKKLY